MKWVAAVTSLGVSARFLPASHCATSPGNNSANERPGGGLRGWSGAAIDGADRIKARPVGASGNRIESPRSTCCSLPANEVVEGGGGVERQLHELDADAGNAAVDAIFARTNPPKLATKHEGLIPIGERESERCDLAHDRALAGGDEDAPEADVTGFGSDGGAAEADDDRNSDIDAAGASDEGHVPSIVAASGRSNQAG